MSINRVLSLWKSSDKDNIVAWQLLPDQPANLVDLPEDLHPLLAHNLSELGIRQLYSHQSLGFRNAHDGQNVVIVTGTASGKTLCYNLPVLDLLLRDPQARALYIYPTKALTQDQLTGLRHLMQHAGHTEDILAGIYDGDTPTNSRSTIRAQARILLTNPDMVHAGILPHHTLWKNFLANLRFIIIDEIHTYRGIFGSHVANVIRRLARVARFYGSQPQYILTSATIANPVELAEKLVGVTTTLVEEDGAPKNERHFLIYNPPLVDRELGLRRSVLQECTRLAGDLVDANVQTLIFCQSRKASELVLTYLRQRPDAAQQDFAAYRSGYLPAQRRLIEQRLRLGELKAVAATNALELGIDIGGVGAVVMAGYPGTIASTRQQAGRAGRNKDVSLAVMVAGPNALDQYLVNHPEYFFGKSPEQALIHPENLMILYNHIRCAAFELPFKAGEAFGTVPSETVHEFLSVLAQSGELHSQNEKFYWMSDQYPSSQVSLRNGSAEMIALNVDNQGKPELLGEVDLDSAYWMVHPGAIYLHDGQPYLVTVLDLEKKTALLVPSDGDYYTEPNREVRVEEKTRLKRQSVVGGEKNLGEITVTIQVKGYQKRRWYNHERIGSGTLDLPPTILNTIGYWITLSHDTVNMLEEQNLWTNNANDYGLLWPLIRQRILERDQHRCQVCSSLEVDRPHHVHHKIPFRAVASLEEANRPENLITVCPTCHHRLETAVRMRSGLAGLSYILGHLAPFFLMCDQNDLGSHHDPKSPLGEGQPVMVIYDNIAGGIGLSERVYEIDHQLFTSARETILNCGCQDGCPSCVGPAAINMNGGKRETLAIFDALLAQNQPAIRNQAESWNH